MGEPYCVCGCAAHEHAEDPPLDPKDYDERGKRTWCYTRGCSCKGYVPKHADTCPKSKRVDGPKHSWKFDGDDPYIICMFCGQVRDALTGRILR